MRQQHDRQIKSVSAHALQAWSRAFVFVNVFVLFSCTDGRYDALLRQADSLNRSGIVFTSDSLAKRLVKHYDHFWHEANSPLLAYYLLGRAHADMGDAPLAIDNYQTAISKADTTSPDCDFRTLRAVYGQMAEVFHDQNLPENELEAQDKYAWYAERAGDTLEAIDGLRRKERAYYLLGEYDSIYALSQRVRKRFLEIGCDSMAARALITSTFLRIQDREYSQAKKYIDIIRNEAGIFDEYGNLKRGREGFYATLGHYHLGIGQMDSAEHYYRKAMHHGATEAAFKGLLSVYEERSVSDSVSKYARLFVLANDSLHRKMNSAEVLRAKSVYDYSYAQKALMEERLETFRLWTALVFFLFIFGFSMAYMVKMYVMQKKKHRREMEIICQESESIREKFETYSALYNALRTADLETEFYSSQIVERFLNKIKGQDKTTPSEEEWLEIQKLFLNCFPAFSFYLKDKRQPSVNEMRLIVLMEIGIMPTEMSRMMGVSLSRISQLKSQISKVYFGDAVQNLQRNLKRIIHIRASEL